ncbi:flagellar basal body P-ring formation chaperone FlgA [Candidatus Margulisiibacteriota bacterium]
MKRLAVFLLWLSLFSGLVLINGVAESKAEPDDCSWVCSKIDKTIASSLKKHFDQWRRARVEAKAFYNKYHLEFLKEISPKDLLEIKVHIPEDSIPAEKMVLKIELMLNQKSWKKFFLRCNIQAWEAVCVAEAVIEKRGILDQSNITLSKKDIAAFSERLYKNRINILGWEAKTKIKKGQIIRTWMVQPLPVFRHGDEINMIYRKEGVVLKFKGKALDDGYIGKKVKCYRLRSRKNFVGTVIERNTVLID